MTNLAKRFLGGGAKDSRSAAQRHCKPTALIDPKVLSLVATHIAEPFAATGRRGLAVCGTTQGAGASFITAHLAIALARTGRRTLLIDSDLRLPGPGLPSERGELSGLLPWLRQQFTAGVPNLELIDEALWWLPSGGSTDQAGELLEDARFQQLIDGFMRDFDVVIADTPPANRWADATIVARTFGCALIIARKDLSYVSDVAVLHGELVDDGVAVLGAVLNGR